MIKTNSRWQKKLKSIPRILLFLNIKSTRNSKDTKIRKKSKDYQYEAYNSTEDDTILLSFVKKFQWVRTI